MTKPEILGSLRSTYTRAVCMLCEEKGIDYQLTETPLAAPTLYAVHPLEQIAILDKAVAATGHLVGDLFTFADINLLPILHGVQQAPEGAEAVKAASHLARYYERHSARPSFRRTAPPPGPPARYRPS